VIPRWVAHTVTIAGVAIAFIASVRHLQGCAWPAIPSTGRSIQWLTSGDYRSKVGFLIDSLTVTMMLVVTFVSLMVHIYTIGYMQEDPGYNRFFSYISLFTFSMLMLVMSNNFMQLFFGWEAVGLVSYLLIGFWYTRPTAIFANMKAFLVNRVGDFGFILGIGLVLATSVRWITQASSKAPDFANRRSPCLLDVTGRPWSLMTVTCICCSSARWASRRRFRCMSGCPIRWKARRRSPR
jgi:NADH-quinone oxidoreductase subunit L